MKAVGRVPFHIHLINKMSDNTKCWQGSGNSGNIAHSAGESGVKGHSVTKSRNNHRVSQLKKK